MVTTDTQVQTAVHTGGSTAGQNAACPLRHMKSVERQTAPAAIETAQVVGFVQYRESSRWHKAEAIACHTRDR